MHPGHGDDQMTRRYVAILEGNEGPASARPVLATEDPELVRAVIQAVRDRLADGPGGADDIVPLRPKGGDHESA